MVSVFWLNFCYSYLGVCIISYVVGHCCYVVGLALQHSFVKMQGEVTTFFLYFQSLLPTLSLLQLQLLQQQLAQQLPMMVDSTPQQQQTPAIDTGLLTQIQALTSVLMSRSGQTVCPSPIIADDKVFFGGWQFSVFNCISFIPHTNYILTKVTCHVWRWYTIVRYWICSEH